MVRAQTRIVAGWLAVCLFLQTTIPGLLVATANCGAASDDAVAGACRFNGEGIGCCCAPSKTKACNCCCSKKSPSSSSAETTSDSGKSRKTRSVGPAFCGCRGSSQFALVVASEPAVLAEVDHPLPRPAALEVTAFEQSYSFARLAPPTPPPEFSA